MTYLPANDVQMTCGRRADDIRMTYVICHLKSPTKSHSRVVHTSSSRRPHVVCMSSAHRTHETSVPRLFQVKQQRTALLKMNLREWTSGRLFHLRTLPTLLSCQSLYYAYSFPLWLNAYELQLEQRKILPSKSVVVQYYDTLGFPLRNSIRISSIVLPSPFPKNVKLPTAYLETVYLCVLFCAGCQWHLYLYVKFTKFTFN